MKLFPRLQLNCGLRELFFILEYMYYNDIPNFDIAHETILFKPLIKKEVHQILKLQLKDLKEKLKEKKVEIDITPEALDYLTESGYSPEYGARPLKRSVQKLIVNKLSKLILTGEITPDSNLLIDCFDSKIVL